MVTILLKRIYDEPEGSDGYRVLVDRLWPRGISKDKAKLDAWLKEVGPGNDLRQWFNHDPAKYEDFRRRYEKELADNPALAELKDIIKDHDTVTMLYGARDPEHNQAQVLKALLER